MKRLITSSLAFLVIILGLNCTNQINKEILDSKSILIKEIIAESEKTMINGNEKIVVMLSDFCEQQDCKEYFKGYEDSILLYNREDIFMRGLDKYTVIENINSNNTSATIKKGRFSKYGKKKEPIIIKINI